VGEDYRWHPIEDLPPDWEKLQHPELDNLLDTWSEQAEELRATAGFDQFQERLKREWSIETGIIEGLYNIDRGITEVLIQAGLEANLIPAGTATHPSEQIIDMLQDHKEVLDHQFEFVAQRRELTIGYVKEVHAALTRHQDSVAAKDQFGHDVALELLRGAWKHLPNNPTRASGERHEYCPPEHVASEMERLVELHADHERQRVPSYVEAAWLHHRFAQIHPFQDGNGRVARTLATLVFLRAGWFPLVITRDSRAAYIDALEAADGGDLEPLVDLFAHIEKHSFLKALTIAEDVRWDQQSLDGVLAAARDKLEQRHQQQIEEQRRVFEIASELEAASLDRLKAVAHQVSDMLKNAHPDSYAVATRSSDDTAHYFKHQIVETARAFDYFADTRTYSAWIRLRIKEERTTDIIVVFHGFGVQFWGTLAATAWVEFRDQTEDGMTSVDGPYPVAPDVFTFTHKESAQNARDRFNGWLNSVIVAALDQWRRQL